MVEVYTYKFFIVFFVPLFGFVGVVISEHFSLGTFVGEFVNHLAKTAEFFFVLFSQVGWTARFQLVKLGLEDFVFAFKILLYIQKWYLSMAQIPVIFDTTINYGHKRLWIQFLNTLKVAGESVVESLQFFLFVCSLMNEFWANSICHLFKILTSNAGGLGSGMVTSLKS